MGYLGKNMHTASNQIVLRNIYKNFGTINALKDISMVTHSGKIHCILGDNGAGKSTLVNIISGVFQPDQGEYTVNEKRVLFKDPRQALDVGISTVYQNLAIIPIMNIYRNFFLGNEPIHGRLNTINKDFAIETTVKELKKFDMKKITFKPNENQGPVIVLIGRRDTGKSFLVRDLLYYHQDIPIGTVISGTEAGNGFYGKMVPKLFNAQIVIILCQVVTTKILVIKLRN